MRLTASIVVCAVVTLGHADLRSEVVSDLRSQRVGMAGISAQLTFDIPIPAGTRPQDTRGGVYVWKYSNGSDLAHMFYKEYSTTSSNGVTAKYRQGWLTLAQKIYWFSYCPDYPEVPVASNQELQPPLVTPAACLGYETLFEDIVKGADFSQVGPDRIKAYGKSGSSPVTLVFKKHANRWVVDSADLSVRSGTATFQVLLQFSEWQAAPNGTLVPTKGRKELRFAPGEGTTQSVGYVADRLGQHGETLTLSSILRSGSIVSNVEGGAAEYTKDGQLQPIAIGKVQQVDPWAWVYILSFSGLLLFSGTLVVSRIVKFKHRNK